MSEILKKPYLSSETYIKLVFYIGAGIFAYATMSSKIEENIRTSERIEKKQDKLQEENLLQRDLMKAQISLIQVDIAVLKKQMENDK